MWRPVSVSSRWVACYGTDLNFAVKFQRALRVSCILSFDADVKPELFEQSFKILRVFSSFHRFFFVFFQVF